MKTIVYKGSAKEENKLGHSNFVFVTPERLLLLGDAGVIPFIRRLTGIFWSEAEEVPWSWSTGTESPVCPQQRL